MITGFESVCPPGGKERTDGLCVATVSDTTGGMQGPYVAIDPNDPDRMALGVNAIATGAAVGDTVSATPVGLFVTQDGGATWNRVQLPQSPTDAHSLHPADPALAFADDDTVLAWTRSGQVDWTVFSPEPAG